jgi:hypothetical protein
MRVRATLIAGLLGALLAAAAPLAGSCTATLGRGAEPTPPKKPSCGIEGFTKSPSEHIIVELDQPFRVRSVEGVIKGQGGDWPEGVSVLFELRPTRGESKLKHANTDGRGSFKIPAVPAGEYCFKATADGWQSVVGVIVVSQDADPANTVTFEMPLGV